MEVPEWGGATVFNQLGTGVFPSKNDALFWYNLYRSGEGDLRTRHAACPVLMGVKWVIFKLGLKIVRRIEGIQQMDPRAGPRVYETMRFG